jgi:uncharacterized membrane protein
MIFFISLKYIDGNIPSGQMKIVFGQLADCLVLLIFNYCIIISLLRNSFKSIFGDIIFITKSCLLIFFSLNCDKTLNPYR